MTNLFYEFVARQIDLALPDNWKQISSEKLLGKPPYQIRHAFNSMPNNGKSTLINILVLPISVRLDNEAENQLIRLRDYIISRNCLLVVVTEGESSLYDDDTASFISESLKINSEYFLWLQCTHDHDGRTTIDGSIFQDLNFILRELWKGRIGYSGPKTGFQQVNLEIMEDICWKCQQEMRTVTGVVFPNKQLKSWANESWKYFNCLLPLSKFEGDHIIQIQQFVERLRTSDPGITPVGIRHSKTIQASYLAASCPSCNALRGNYYVDEARTTYLFSLESRFDGSLVYHSIGLNMTSDLIEELYSVYEVCDHTCVNGWERK